MRYDVSSGFFLLSGFVGAGLLFAGVTGFCGMARLLKVMHIITDRKHITSSSF
jgi:hypothetical protein